MRGEVKGIMFCSWQEHLNLCGREGGEAEVHAQVSRSQERLVEQPGDCGQGLEGLEEM